MRHAIILIIMLTIVARSGFAQPDFDNSEKCFAWKVKQVDEFIERFNNERNTLIKQYVAKHNSGLILTRRKLLLSLFDQSKHWDLNDARQFIDDVDSPSRPCYLDFFDPNWCAKVNCKVDWHGHSEKVQLTLRVQKISDSRSKWVVTDADAVFLKQAMLSQKGISDTLKLVIPMPVDESAAFDPYCHVTRFMDLTLLSTDKKNIGNYFSLNNNPNPQEFIFFIHEIVEKRLLIISTDPFSIRYYFNNVKGWAFEVKEFNRQTTNSGWLISNLTKAG